MEDLEEEENTSAFTSVAEKLEKRFGLWTAVLDFETTGVDPKSLRVTCGAVLRAGVPGVHVFTEDGMFDAWKQWIEPCNVLIAHNAQFEVRVLRLYIHADALGAWLRRVKIVDMFALLGDLGCGFISLANLCHCNASRVPFAKTGKGGDAITLAAEGRTAELEDYNAADVMATAALAVCEAPLECCVGVYDQSIDAQRHLGTAVVDLQTLTVKCEARFPVEANGPALCYCALKYREDRGIE
jgi:hypothetical protein